MNRNENEAESFAGNFMAFGEEALFFEVPLSLILAIKNLVPLVFVLLTLSRRVAAHHDGHLAVLNLDLHSHPRRLRRLECAAEISFLEQARPARHWMASCHAFSVAPWPWLKPCSCAQRACFD